MVPTRTTRLRMRDTVSATYVVEMESGLVRVYGLSIVPSTSIGPPRVLFVRFDPGMRDTGRAVQLPGLATAVPPTEYLVHAVGVDEAEASAIVAFLLVEMPKLIQPSPDPRDRSQDGDFYPIEDEEVDEGPESA